MKLGKISLAIIAATATFTASAQIYNTGYSTSVVGGQLVDNLWTVTQLQSLPGGASFPAVPYSAFVLPSATVTWPWDLSAPVGTANNATTLWDTSQQPAFSGVDNVGMVTTYTLNFNGVAGLNTIYYESDNYVAMYLGSVTPAHLFYADAPANTLASFQNWQHQSFNIAASGANQLNILVYNYPLANTSLNYTGLRVNFGVSVVPEPSTMTLVAGGLVALVAAARRRTAK